MRILVVERRRHLQPRHRRARPGRARVRRRPRRRAGRGAVLRGSRDHATRPVRSRPTRIFEASRPSGSTGRRPTASRSARSSGRTSTSSSPGVNLGPNLGNATWHSGTLAAAKQATLLGIRGIALSAPVSDEEPDFSPLEPWLDTRARLLLLDERCPRLVNVNFPREPRGFAGRRRRSTSTTAASFPPTIRWDASTTGSPSSRSSATPREPTSGRSSRDTSRSPRSGSTSPTTGTRARRAPRQ